MIKTIAPVLLGGLIVAMLFFMLMGCDFRASPSEPDIPVYTEGRLNVLWRGPDQIELQWDDMPITAYGGSEQYVWTRRTSIPLPEYRKPVRGNSFMGFDRGDVVEAEVAVFDHMGREIYRRSLHKEEGDNTYEAFWPLSYEGPPTNRLHVDLTCRVNGTNQLDSLTARCHFAVIITFGEKDGI